LTYTEKKRRSFGRGFHGFGKGKRDADTLAAQRNFESRSKRSQNQDLHRFATIAPNIEIYLKAPGKYDWKGVDDPNILAKINTVTNLAKKTPVHMIVKDGKAKKTHHFKIVKKSEAPKEVAKELAKIEELTKNELHNPIIDSHKLPSEAEILSKAQSLYMAENFKGKYEDSAPEVLPTKSELREEGFLQKAKLDLMTSQDGKASREVFDYVDHLRGELEKIGFTVTPLSGFDVSDLQY
jgi:hypothetical protein